MASPIRLRGHHLATLSDYIFCEWYGRFATKTNRKHFYEERIKSGYGKDFARKVPRIYYEILRNPSLQIILIDTPDNVCNSNCQKRDNSCADPWELDHKIARGFGLEIREEPYLASEIIDPIMYSTGLKRNR